MSAVRRSSTLVLAVVVVAGCGAGSNGGSATGAGPAPSTAAPSTAGTGGSVLAATAPDGSTIPDGTWARTATAADAAELGLPDELVTKHVGADGVLRVELRVKGDGFAQFVDDDGGTLVLGDRGTAGYDTAGRWVTTSASEGCPGCGATFRWSVSGDSLTLAMEDTHGNDDPVDVLVGRLVTEGTYTRG